MLGLTNRCNGKCIMCWHSNKVQHRACDLPLSVYDELERKLFRRIHLLNLSGGGEILLYPYIDKVLTDIQKYKFTTTMTSNFSNVSDKYRDMLSKIRSEFVVSLDGTTPNIQNFIRPGCDFDKVIYNIKYFKARGKKITIQTTVSNHNFYDMENMIKLAGSLGVDVLKFQDVQFLENMDRPYRVEKPPHDIAYLDRILKGSKVPTCVFFDFYHRPLLKIPFSVHKLFRWWESRHTAFCPNTVGTLKVQENGLVLSCCLPESKIVGDLRKDDLEKIIDNEQYEAIRRNCRCQMLSSFFIGRNK